MIDKNQSIRDQAEALVARLEKTNWADEPFDIDCFVYRVLSLFNKIAVTWCVDDVLGDRPHLTRDQAWEVLQRVKDKHDADWGISWETLRTVADDLFGDDTDGTVGSIEF